MGKGTSINYPEQQPYGEGMREALQAQVELAPELYRAEASKAYGRPAYAQLEGDILRSTLLGQPAGTAGGREIASEKDKFAAYVDFDPRLKGTWDRQGPIVSKYKGDKAAWGKAHWGAHGQREGRFLPQVGKTYDMSAAGGGERGSIYPEVGAGGAREGGLMELIGAPAQQFEAGGEMRRPGYDPSGQFGGLAQYGADIAQFGATRQRAADIRDVGMMGQEASRAIREADPLSAVLMSEMGGQAIEELGARDALTARERRGAVQEARQAMEARGRQLDPMAAVAELENLERAKRARRMERRGFAQQAMGASRAMSADPFMAILGRPSGAGQQIAQQGMGQAGYGLSAGPQLYSPESGLSYMLGQQTNQMNLAGAQASADAQRSAGMMGMAGSILAAPMTGGVSLLGTAFGK